MHKYYKYYKYWKNRNNFRERERTFNKKGH